VQVFLEKFVISQLVNKFSAFMESVWWIGKECYTSVGYIRLYSTLEYKAVLNTQ